MDMILSEAIRIAKLAGTEIKEHDCKVRHGVVYNPFLDEMYCASENSGAFLNGNAYQNYNQINVLI